MARPSGALSPPPEVSTRPVPAEVCLSTASGIRVIRFLPVSATYRLPLRPTPSPVGPTTNAEGSVRSEKPEPTLVTLRIAGGFPRPNARSSRRTVPRCTTAPCAATVPFSTLATKSAADRLAATTVASHGPLMPWPRKIFRTLPLSSRTNRHPGDDVAAWPFIDGRFPTMTQPCTRTRAVVSPTPPGHRPGSDFCVMCANTLRCPPGLIWTIVEPVPCRFLELLKLLTRMSPMCRRPRLRGTTTTPYGLTSPLRGTVEAILLV